MMYVGLLGGLSFGIAGWYWYFRQRSVGKGGLDEVHAYMATKSRSISWYFTLAAIAVLMALEVADLSMGTIPSLGMLLFVHLGSWGLASILIHARMIKDHDETAPGKLLLVQGIGIGLAILILLAIIAVLLGS